MRPRAGVVLLFGFAAALSSLRAAGPSSVDITWMSMANLHYQIGDVGIVTDGYVTRIPQEAFYGGQSGLAQTREPYLPDRDGVERVLAALGGPAQVNLLMTGHSHWDHSFDTGTWATLTAAPVIGSQTTCYQVMAEDIPEDSCTVVTGGEEIEVADDVTMFVVRWNHSGDPARNPEQHNAVELEAVPTPDPSTGGLRAGVAEDFPNGGGTRGYLFVVDGPDGRFSWFQQSSASAVDLDVPIVVDGVDYGSPIDNLGRAMEEAGLLSVDLWIGTTGLDVAQRVVPLIRPKYYLPIHWDGLWEPFEAGMPRSFSAPPLEAFLDGARVDLIEPKQYMDTWRLDRRGVRAISNTSVKTALGFSEVQSFP